LKKVHSNRHYEVIVVDDGSTDDSPSIIRQMEEKPLLVKGLFHATNLGIGAALRTGYQAASNELVCAIPADGQFDVSELDLVPQLKEGQLESFFRIKPYQSPFRIGLNRLNRFLNQRLLRTQIKDVNWVNVYRREGLKNLDQMQHLNTPLIGSALCGQLVQMGHEVIQIPSRSRSRKHGKSKAVSPLRLIRTFREVFLLYKP